MKVVALIPARSGSKGLKHKNVRKLGGRPLLEHAVRLASTSARRGEEWRVVVSSDSAAYRRLARDAGATAIARPKALASDAARLIDVVLHAMAGTECDLVVLLSPTTPLTRVGDVRRVVDAWKRHGVGIASVCLDTPPSLRFTVAGGKLHALADKPPGRRQEEPTCYRLNGAIYAASLSWLVRHRRFVVAGKSMGVVMPKQRSVDIEDADDLAMATTLANDAAPAYPS